MLITRPRLSEAEFLRLPDDGRKYELVEGEPREVPTSFEHDHVGVNLLFLLGPHTRGRGYLTMAQAGFRMRSGNIRCPDTSFTRKERLPGGKPPRGFADGAPDLAVEIISPSEERAEILAKLTDYFESGAQQVWYVLPETRQVVVYTSPFESHTLGADDELTGGDLLPTFPCRVSELFLTE
jgi:Uma2 family endonuclease